MKASDVVSNFGLRGNIDNFGSFRRTGLTGPQSIIFLVYGCLKSSFLPPACATVMLMLLEPSGLTLVVYYRQGIKCAPHNNIEINGT